MAVNRVMQAVGYVQKDRRAEFGDRYKYASESAFISAIRAAMVDEGLFLYPSAHEFRNEEHAPTKQGMRQWRCDTVVTWTLCHTSGESCTLQTIGCGIDSGDKGAPKAQTGAYKYAIRQLFMLETGDDPDDTHSAKQESRVQKQDRPQGGASRPAQENAPGGKREHHPSFKDKEKGAFFARLSELGVNYETLAEMCEAEGKPRPSQVDADARKKLLDWLGTDKGKSKYTSFANVGN